MLFHNKDDIQFVTEFLCFWDTLYLIIRLFLSLHRFAITIFQQYFCKIGIGRNCLPVSIYNAKLVGEI